MITKNINKIKEKYDDDCLCYDSEYMLPIEEEKISDRVIFI